MKPSLFNFTSAVCLSLIAAAKSFSNRARSATTSIDPVKSNSTFTEPISTFALGAISPSSRRKTKAIALE